MPGDRDWRKYNEALVRRGELDIDPSVLEDWGRELRRANGGKVGGAALPPLPGVLHGAPRVPLLRLLFHTP
jgi:hypothetical protein